MGRRRLTDDIIGFFMDLGLRLVPAHDRALRSLCDPVRVFGPVLIELAANLAEEMYYKRGHGLAAPQVGLSLRLVVIDVSSGGTDLKIMANPVIVQRSAFEQASIEGCLSLPGREFNVVRANECVVEYDDVDGISRELPCSGLLSIAVQHELDHLDGVLVSDRACARPPTLAQVRLSLGLGGATGVVS